MHIQMLVDAAELRCCYFVEGFDMWLHAAVNWMRKLSPTKVLNGAHVLVKGLILSPCGGVMIRLAYATASCIGLLFPLL
ncbi:hypothetical protein V9T40_004864 [Parthenolecanium corni]|uniref:Uncharacterized protein n=1 Tax=Parthenolecanium corni TaxID=536013 RepID=A0AAN9TEM3_9HEMI